jgi:hypothetical protein
MPPAVVKCYPAPAGLRKALWTAFVSFAEANFAKADLVHGVHARMAAEALVITPDGSEGDELMTGNATLHDGVLLGCC